jgi:quercetin dioxygenase-like cupin family protein
MKPSAVLSLSVMIAAVTPINAQYGSSAMSSGQVLPWENNRVRVQYMTVEPGASVQPLTNRVMVYLTGDADGRMPAAAILQAPGALQNRSRVRIEAISIDLKDAPAAAGGTPAEAFESHYGVEVTPVVDDPHVFVTKLRYDAAAYGGALHAHPEDVLVVYLRGGYTWPADGYGYASRVRRGDVMVVPANTLHRLANAGSDPIEMLVIVPR